jgi:hypothetical protein
MKNAVYNVLFVAVILLLLLHLAFSNAEFLRGRPLHGSYQKSAEPRFSPQAYFSLDFQDSTESFVKTNFGFSPPLIRLHHQFEYSVFDRVNVVDVHKGRDGYLFRYAPTYFDGETYVPDTLKNFLKRYAAFGDSMKQKGKKIIWVIAPDKSSVLPEFLPDIIRHRLRSPANSFYADFKDQMLARKFDVLDFNALACNEKTKYPFPVFSRVGVHWAHPYAARCFDSLCNYLSAKGAVDLHTEIHSFPVTIPWEPDLDMESAANLMFPLQKEPFFHATLNCQGQCKQKKVLLIGDSFCYAAMWQGWFASCFSPESEFWYYNREATRINNEPLPALDHSQTHRAVEKFDLIIFLFSAGNLHMLDWGFLKDYHSGK